MLKILKRFFTANGIFVGFVEGIAKTQLRCLRRYQKSFSEKSQYELYIDVISARPGYSRQEAEKHVRVVKESSEQGGTLFNFQQVVFQLAFEEFYKEMKELPTEEQAERMVNIINQIIPTEL